MGNDMPVLGKDSLYCLWHMAVIDNVFFGRQLCFFNLSQYIIFHIRFPITPTLPLLSQDFSSSFFLLSFCSAAWRGFSSDALDLPSHTANLSAYHLLSQRAILIGIWFVVFYSVIAMPPLLNYSGADQLCTASSPDLGGFFKIGSNVDVYFPPSKRARLSGPFSFDELSFRKANEPSIEVLPDECLFEIFRRLQGGKERSLCACVSKRWLMIMGNICKDEICKHKNLSGEPASKDFEMLNHDSDQDTGSDASLTRCLEGKKATDVRLAAIAVGTSSCGGLGKLSILGSNSVRGVTNRGLSAIAHGCPSLRDLSLWNISSVGDEGLSEIAKHCPLLEKIDLCHCPSIGNKGLISIAEGCPNLSVLSIESCQKIGNEGLQAIGKFCPKLKSISIKDCPFVGDHGVSSVLSSAKMLSKVKLQALNISDFSLAVVGHYGKSITNLVLSGLQNVSDKGFWVVGVAQDLQKLVSLTISSCRGVTDMSMEAMGKGFTSLKHLCLRNCRFVSDHGLITFSKAASSLENLQLEECSGVTQSGIIGAMSNFGTRMKSLALVKCMGIRDIDVRTSMLSSCASLRSLAIRNCPGFGNASLAVIGKLCPRLQHLDLTALCGITDAGLNLLFEDCEAGVGLTKVNLSGCLNLTDEAVISLTKLHGGTLEILNLDGCRKVTDTSMVAIADNCLLLNDLDISKCVITDNGLAILSSAEHLNITVLSLSGCCNITKKSFPFLKKLGKTLVGLNVKLCNSIGSSTIELLLKSLWRCDILA